MKNYIVRIVKNNMEQISDSTKKDIINLCGYILDTEYKDCMQQIEEGGDVEDHPYTLAKRIYESLE